MPACIYLKVRRSITWLRRKLTIKKKISGSYRSGLLHNDDNIPLCYRHACTVCLREFGVIGNDDSDSDAGIKSPVYNTLFARVNSKGVLADATVIRVAPDAKKIIIMPVSAFTVSGSQTMREIHEEGGMVKLEAAVADTFGITIDNYVSLTNDAFENAADIVGGITYTPDEELLLSLSG